MYLENAYVNTFEGTHKTVHGRIRDLTDDDVFYLVDQSVPIFQFLVTGSQLREGSMASETTPSVTTRPTTPISRSPSVQPVPDILPPRAPPRATSSQPPRRRNLRAATADELADLAEALHHDNKGLFKKRPDAAVLHTWVKTAYDYIADDPYIVKDNVPVAYVDPAEFYKAVCPPRDAETYARHLKYYHLALELEAKSTTIRRVLDGEKMCDAMKPWVTDGKVKAVSVQDF